MQLDEIDNICTHAAYFIYLMKNYMNHSVVNSPGHNIVTLSLTVAVVSFITFLWLMKILLLRIRACSVCSIGL